MVCRSAGQREWQDRAGYNDWCLQRIYLADLLQPAQRDARITTGGVITEHALPASFSTPSGITSGSGVSGLWIAALNGNSIGGAPACALGLTASFANEEI